MTRGLSRVSLRFGQVLLWVVGLFLVTRGIVELFTTDASRPETYRTDWGGPHYLGVIAVHSGPGLLIAVGVCWYLVRRRRGRRAQGD